MDTVWAIAKGIGIFCVVLGILAVVGIVVITYSCGPGTNCFP